MSSPSRLHHFRYWHNGGYHPDRNRPHPSVVERRNLVAPIDAEYKRRFAETDDVTAVQEWHRLALAELGPSPTSEWISWFVDGKAVHCPVDSKQSQEWAAQLASHADRRSRTCDLCGNTFMARRSDAQFCSRKCRQRAAYRRAS